MIRLSVCAGHLRQERPPHLHPDLLHPALRERGRAIPQSHVIPRIVERDGRVSHVATLSSCRLIVWCSEQCKSSVDVCKFTTCRFWGTQWRVQINLHGNLPQIHGN
jgi:hypothetical protein